MMGRWFLSVFVTWLLGVPGLAFGLNEAALCDRAALYAAKKTGVPVAVLQAITRTETARGMGQGSDPWPWAVNQAGKGYWFDSFQEAQGFVENQLAMGAENIDIGCFQLNYRWHGSKFSSLEDMFDPKRNALNAALFLAEKYAQLGDWYQAAGAYHSQTPEKARIYLARFERHLADQGNMPDGLLPLQDATQAERQNNFPLLMAGQGQSTMGSLVPQVAGRGSLFARIP